MGIFKIFGNKVGYRGVCFLQVIWNLLPWIDVLLYYRKLNSCCALIDSVNQFVMVCILGIESSANKVGVGILRDGEVI